MRHLKKEKINKRTLNFNYFFRVIFLFPQKCISDAILWEKKDNSKLCNVYRHKWLVTMFTINTFMRDLSSVDCPILSKSVCTFFDDFL